MLNYWKRDASLKLRNAIFTLGSCGLSGYAGWLLASDIGMAIQVVSAVIFAGIAYSLSESVVALTRYRLARDKEGYNRNLRMAMLLVVVNLMTDYSASVTLRDFSITNTQNANTNANNAQNEVKRIETRQAEIRKQTAWQTKYLAPEAYDGMISAQKHAVSLEGSKGGCLDKCQLEKKKLASLQANKANAQQRSGLVAEMTRLDAELKQAKTNVKDTPKKGNPALAPIIGLLSLLTQNLEHDKTEVQHGLNHYLLIITFAITGAIWYLSAEIGTRAGPMRDPEPLPETAPREDYWRPPRLEAPEGHKAIPLHAETIPQSLGPSSRSSTTESSVTVNYQDGARPSRERIAALQRMLREEFPEIANS